jgi:hypothetical protein
MALPHWRCRSHMLMWVWAVGDGSGQWTEVLGGGQRWCAMGNVEGLWHWEVVVGG